jgi:hypothetical protein
MRALPSSANALIAAVTILGLPADGIAEAGEAPRASTGQAILVPYQPQPAETSYARAQWEALARTHVAQEPSRSWYGYQIVLSDLAFVGMGLATQRGEVTLAGYFLAPILVHAAHRRPELAVASPIVRIILPLLGLAIGSMDRSCNQWGDECGLGGMIYGTGIGLAAAVILDWSWAWTSPATPTPASRGYALEDSDQRSPSQSSGLAITAAGLAPNNKGVSFVLGGQF